MNKPFTSGQEVRNMPICRDNAPLKASGAPPVPRVVDETSRPWLVVEVMTELGPVRLVAHEDDVQEGQA